MSPAAVVKITTGWTALFTPLTLDAKVTVSVISPALAGSGVATTLSTVGGDRSTCTVLATWGTSTFPAQSVARLRKVYVPVSYPVQS